MELKWSEMGWWYGSNEFDKKLLGEAGNSSYRVEDQCQAMRTSDFVLITSEHKMTIISADTIVRGFGEDKDGKSLRELMKEEVIYNYALRC